MAIACTKSIPSDSCVTWGHMRCFSKNPQNPNTEDPEMMKTQHTSFVWDVSCHSMSFASRAIRVVRVWPVHILLCEQDILRLGNLFVSVSPQMGNGLWHLRDTAGTRCTKYTHNLHHIINLDHMHWILPSYYLHHIYIYNPPVDSMGNSWAFIL